MPKAAFWFAAPWITGMPLIHIPSSAVGGPRSLEGRRERLPTQTSESINAYAYVVPCEASFIYMAIIIIADDKLTL